MRVSELINFENGSWDEETVRSTFKDDEWSSVLDIPVLSLWPKDRLYCWPTSNGNYSIRSEYWLGRMGHLRTWELFNGVEETDMWKEAWRLEGSPKLKHFVWRVCKGSLPIRLRLCHRHVSSDSDCQNHDVVRLVASFVELTAEYCTYSAHDGAGAVVRRFEGKWGAEVAEAAAASYGVSLAYRLGF
ncbi:Olfactory receptor 51Q1 [Bienertia sinuspersici]